MTTVFLLFELYAADPPRDGEDARVVGVYASRADAMAVRDRQADRYVESLRDCGYDLARNAPAHGWFNSVNFPRPILVNPMTPGRGAIAGYRIEECEVIGAAS